MAHSGAEKGRSHGNHQAHTGPGVGTVTGQGRAGGRGVLLDSCLWMSQHGRRKQEWGDGVMTRSS